MRTPDVYNRVCIWQPASGFVVDLYRNDFKRAATPAVSQTFFEGADGIEYESGRGWLAEFQITSPVAISQLRKMKAIGCPVNLFAIGWNRGVAWLENTAFDLIPGRPGPGGHAFETFRLNNIDARPKVSDAPNLLAPFDWFGGSIEQAVDAAGTPVPGMYYVWPPHGSASDLVWIIRDATVPPTLDNEGRLSTDGSASVYFPFPVGGATVTLDTGGENANVEQIQVEALNWEGGAMDAANPGVPLMIPAQTWLLGVESQPVPGQVQTIHPPRLVVSTPGRYAGTVFPRTGLIPIDCNTPSGMPKWAETEYQFETLFMVYRNEIHEIPLAQAPATFKGYIPAPAGWNLPTTWSTESTRAWYNPLDDYVYFWGLFRQVGTGFHLPQFVKFKMDGGVPVPGSTQIIFGEDGTVNTRIYSGMVSPDFKRRLVYYATFTNPANSTNFDSLFVRPLDGGGASRLVDAAFAQHFYGICVDPKSGIVYAQLDDNSPNEGVAVRSGVITRSPYAGPIQCYIGEALTDEGFVLHMGRSYSDIKKLDLATETAFTGGGATIYPAVSTAAGCAFMVDRARKRIFYAPAAENQWDGNGYYVTSMDYNGLNKEVYSRRPGGGDSLAYFAI